MVPEHTVGPGESLGASLQPIPVRRRNFAAALVGYCAAERRHVPGISSLSGQGIAFPVAEILVPRTVTARDALYRIAARALACTSAYRLTSCATDGPSESGGGSR